MTKWANSKYKSNCLLECCSDLLQRHAASGPADMNFVCGFCLEVWNIYPDLEGYTNPVRHWPRHPNLKTVNLTSVITESIKNNEYFDQIGKQKYF